MNRPIYLDYAATTPVDERVADKMAKYLTKEGCFGNPASNSHSYGIEAKKAVEHAREQVASLIGAEPREIIWTSGATESDNLAIKGASYFNQKKGRHIITSLIEHKAVLGTCQDLEKAGFDITYLKPETNGLISIEALKEAIREDTILVSVMHVNNEIGVIQNIKEIGELTREKGIYFHTDAAQSAGKIPIDVRNTNVDLISFSGHKVYGPKGIGALYIRQNPRARLLPQMSGGGQERGFRSGTLATHQIVGMGEAFDIAKQEMQSDHQRIQHFCDQLITSFHSIPDVFINGDRQQAAPTILNVSFACIDGEALLMALRDLAFSTGSACTSANVESSHVLRAIGVSDALAHGAIRLSIGRYTTQGEIDQAIHLIKDNIEKLRAISPLWNQPQQRSSEK